MTKILKCKGIEGLNRKCPFEWRGHSEDEVVDKAVEHITSWHRPQNVQEILWRARNVVRDEPLFSYTQLVSADTTSRISAHRWGYSQYPDASRTCKGFWDQGTREYMAGILTLQTTGSQCGQPTRLVSAARVSGIWTCEF